HSFGYSMCNNTLVTFFYQIIMKELCYGFIIIKRKKLITAFGEGLLNISLNAISFVNIGTFYECVYLLNKLFYFKRLCNEIISVGIQGIGFIFKTCFCCYEYEGKCSVV